MFKRAILSSLEKWAAKRERKPLVIRGARQVGKTTLVNQFATRFDQYIYLNLELPEDKRPFQQFSTVETLLESIFFIKNKTLSRKHKTLLFIDEIQELPEALNLLRYLHEDAKELYVIAAGSLLESLFDQHISFPVGRVEYLVVRPVSFPEFLGAIGEDKALEQLQNIPLNNFATDKLMKLFHTYALIGGMPEIVSRYAENKDITAVGSMYESLLVSYMDDVEKYASVASQIDYIRHVIRSAFSESGTRIKFQNFGKSNYGSREMSESLRILEKAMLLQLVFPSTSAVLPLIPDLKKSPRLQVLDTGLMNYYMGVQKEIIGTDDLSKIYQGRIIEHLTGQELLATQHNVMGNLHFWVREKKSSSAEVNYLYPFDGKVIPIEVKSGSEGKLKSLHLFMDEAPHNMAIRFYAGKLSISKAVTPNNKNYYLLNLPYYLVSQTENYLKWFKKEVEKMSK